MDCREVRDRLLEGAPTPEALAHAGTCEACAALVAGGGALARKLASDRAVSDRAAAPDVAALFRGVEAEVARDEGPLAWLKSRPTWQRRALLALAAFPMGAAVVARHGLRPAVKSSPDPVVWLGLALLAAGAPAVLFTALRPLHAPHGPLARSYAKAAAGIAAAFAIALLPFAELPGAPHASAHLNLGCYSIGLALGAPVLLAALALRRHASLAATVLFAVGAGLAANFAVMLICPATEAAHTLVAHATVPLTFAALALALGALGSAVGRG